MGEGNSFGTCAVLLEERLKGVLDEPPPMQQVLQQGQQQGQGQLQGAALGEADAMRATAAALLRVREEQQEQLLLEEQPLLEARAPDPAVAEAPPAQPVEELEDEMDAEERVRALEAKLAALRKRREV